MVAVRPAAESEAIRRGNDVTFKVERLQCADVLVGIEIPQASSGCVIIREEPATVIEKEEGVDRRLLR